MFDEQLQLTGKNLKIQQELDLTKYQQMSTKSCIYKLFAIVACEGSDLNDSTYTSFVKRFKKTTNQIKWFRFTQEIMHEVNIDSHLPFLKPQLIFYELQWKIN